MAEESIFLLSGLVVGGPALPGLVLCVPGMLFVVVPVVVLLAVPALAIGLLATAAGVVAVLAAVPVRVGWWGARRVRRSLAGRRVLRPLTLPGRHPRTALRAPGLAATASSDARRARARLR